MLHGGVKEPNGGREDGVRDAEEHVPTPAAHPEARQKQRATPHLPRSLPYFSSPRSCHLLRHRVPGRDQDDESAQES